MMKHLRNLIAPIIAAVLTALLMAPLANGAFYQWSKIAANNDTADPTINWAEGMSPSSVNDSARAMMARAAGYRDDISGSLVTTGTGSAYLLATNQGFDTLALMDGAMIAFTPNVTNTGNVSLAVDGLTAKSIRSQTGSAGDLGAGVLIAGTPYVVTYNNSNNEFVLQGFAGNPYAIPIGGLLPYTGATAPNSNFVLPYGQCISRTTYAAYFAQVSTTFGACDGTTTFAVPDVRGRVIAAIDGLGGTGNAGRLTTAYFGSDPTVIGNVGGLQNRTLAQTNLPSGVSLPYSASGTFDVLSNGNLARAPNNIDGQNNVTIAGGDVFYTAPAFHNLSVNVTLSGTAPLGGSSTPVATIMPAMTISYILRVL